MHYTRGFKRAASLTLAFVIFVNGFAASRAASRPAEREPSAPRASHEERAAGRPTLPLAGTVGERPVAFEPNRGQAGAGRVKFLSRNKGYTLFLTNEGASMSLRRGASIVRMQLVGSNRGAPMAGESGLPGRVNYLRGSDPRAWLTNVETYARVRHAGVYRGVDLVYYGSGGQIEYDFVVAPGTDPGVIRFRLRGGRASLGAEGDLVVRTSAGDLTLRRPVLYQESAGVRREVSGGYVLGHDGTVRFRVGRYDRALPLVIDPVIAYAGFFGGDSDNTYENDIAVDSAGSAYVVGYTSSTHIFPTTPGAFKRTDPEGDGETFVVKLSPDGRGIVYSTYLGPGVGRSIAVDPAGNAYVTGIAGKDFPVRNGFQTAPADNGPGYADAFLLKLNPAGSDLLYSTYIGGADGDLGYGVAADPQGNAYVSGETSSANFPVTQGAARTALAGVNDSFVLKVNTAAAGVASLVYSTYTEVGGAVAVDSEGSAYAAGHPIRWKKQSVVKLNPAGTAVVYNYDVSGDAVDSSTLARWYAKDIAVDSAGSAYVTGSVPGGASSPLPAVGGFQAAFGGGQVDAFLAKLSPAGTGLLYSTYLGGAGNEVGRGVAVDSSGRAYVAGNTTSFNFPTREPVQAIHNGGIPDGPDIVTAETGGPSDAFVSKIDTAAAGAASLVYSTYYGFDLNETGNAVALGSQGAAYVLGGLAPFGIPGIIHTPRTQPAAYSSQAGGVSGLNDGGHFVVKLADSAASTMQFEATAYTASEAGRSARLTVTRGGDAAGPATVNYMTLDGAATNRSDYTAGFGTLRFAAGERTKSLDVLVTDDARDEADETLSVALINPSSGVALAAPASAVLTITDNDSSSDGPNPLDDAAFFVRQHYLDFLGREPDAAGQQFWTNQITECGANASCTEIRRINVSAAFFLSIEFQETGLYAIRLQRVAAGRTSRDSRLSYREFIRAARQVGEGVVVGEAGADQALEANKQAYAEGVASSTAFVMRFPETLGADQYVAALFASAGVTPTAAERQAAVNAYGAGGFAGRVAALRSASDSASVRAAERDTAFVLLQYFGYLRRDPDEGGYQFWLKKLLEHGGNFVNAEMVKSFITSEEYRERFGR